MLCRACRRAVALANRASPAPRLTKPTVFGREQLRRAATASTKKRQSERSTLRLGGTPSSPGRAWLSSESSSVSGRVRLMSTSASATAAAETPAGPATSPSSLEKPDFLDDAESQIWDILAAEFHPVELSVRDVSGGCGSMYDIQVSSDKFRGANMLKQQRMVNTALGDMLKGWHGLQLKTRVP